MKKILIRFIVIILLIAYPAPMANSIALSAFLLYMGFCGLAVTGGKYAYQTYFNLGNWVRSDNQYDDMLDAVEERINGLEDAYSKDPRTGTIKELYKLYDVRKNIRDGKQITDANFEAQHMEDFTNALVSVAKDELLTKMVPTGLIGKVVREGGSSITNEGIEQTVEVIWNAYSTLQSISDAIDDSKAVNPDSDTGGSYGAYSPFYMVDASNFNGELSRADIKKAIIATIEGNGGGATGEFIDVNFAGEKGDLTTEGLLSTINAGLSAGQDVEQANNKDGVYDPRAAIMNRRQARGQREQDSQVYQEQVRQEQARQMQAFVNLVGGIANVVAEQEQQKKLAKQREQYNQNLRHRRHISQPRSHSSSGGHSLADGHTPQEEYNAKLMMWWLHDDGKK